MYWLCMSIFFNIINFSAIRFLYGLWCGEYNNFLISLKEWGYREIEYHKCVYLYIYIIITEEIIIMYGYWNIYINNI